MLADARAEADALRAQWEAERSALIERLDLADGQVVGSATAAGAVRARAVAAEADALGRVRRDLRSAGQVGQPPHPARRARDEPVAPPADPDQLLNQWAAVNRSARMQVLLDVSGSMKGERVRTAAATVGALAAASTTAALGMPAATAFATKNELATTVAMRPRASADDRP